MNYILLSIFTFLFTFVGLVSASQAQATFELPKVTICHTPPPVDETKEVPISALFGHLGHGDYLGACVPVEEEPTDYCDTIEGTQPEDFDCPKEEEPTCEELQNCELEVTPTPEPCRENCGTPPTFAGSSTEAPKPVSCTIPFEVARTWYGDGKLSWANDAQGIQKFSITYGPDKDHLIYGVDNIPADARSLDKPGYTEGWNQLWFSVWTWVNGCTNQSEPIDP